MSEWFVSGRFIGCPYRLRSRDTWGATEDCELRRGVTPWVIGY